jgi:hypothetical protein
MKPIRTLRQCLIDLDLARLRVIARLWGLEVQATRPREVAARLAEALADPAHAADTYATLPSDVRAALAALLDAGGLMPAAIFTRRFGEIRPMGPGRLERETPWRDPVGPAEGLWYRGLIYEGFAGEAGETYPVYFVPDELRAALPLDDQAAPDTLQLEALPPPAHRRAAGDRFLDDVTTILAFIHNATVQPLPDAPHAWPEEARRALARGLRDPNTERLAFILHLLDHLGWTRQHDDGRLGLAAGPVTAWLKETGAKSRAVLVDAWREMTAWNELWRLPSLQPDDTGTWHNDPTLARAALMRHLGALTPGQWVSLNAFIGAIKATDPDFQRPDGDYETWYIRDAASGAYLSGFESWDAVEGALLHALLNGPAWWLGLVELGGKTENDPPAVFCPAPETAPLPSPPSAVVHPDLRITMPFDQACPEQSRRAHGTPSARHFERFQLARVADLIAVDEDYVYGLTPASLGRARQQKISDERVLSFLESLNDAPLPQGVRSSVTRWARQGTEVWLERALLLRVSDKEVLEQILAAPQARRYVSRVVGPTAAVVAEEDWSRLAAALVELGLMAELIGVQDA